ncbi:MAG: TetR/AcrR family transcriptional regulator [Myxococcota bacterium]
MSSESVQTPPTRGHRKREKTRRQLVEAGLRVLAEEGEALTVSQVVAAADVSNGTFYNYFHDREELLDVLSEQLILSLTAAAAGEPEEDPAMRFARASGRVLQRAVADPTWGRVMLRLVNRPGVQRPIDTYLREDLAAGFEQGRFDTGPDDATVDQVLGLLVLTIRRIVEGLAAPDAPARAVERGLRALGVSEQEARSLARRALAD